MVAPLVSWSKKSDPLKSSASLHVIRIHDFLKHRQPISLFPSKSLSALAIMVAIFDLIVIATLKLISLRSPPGWMRSRVSATFSGAVKNALSKQTNPNSSIRFPLAAAVSSFKVGHFYDTIDCVLSGHKKPIESFLVCRVNIWIFPPFFSFFCGNFLAYHFQLSDIVGTSSSVQILVAFFSEPMLPKDISYNLRW